MMRNFLISKNKIRIIFVSLLSLYFLCILGYYLIHTILVRSFNNTERFFSNVYKNSAIEYYCYPRNGSQDSWYKTGVRIDDTRKDLQATIYEAKIINNFDYTMHDWKIRINIRQRCFLNNAWCGLFEIHQFRSGTEYVQTLDLREAQKFEIELETVGTDQDILIRLEPDDYIIYIPHPDIENSIHGHRGNILIGYIFYYEDDYLDLSDYKFTYHLTKPKFTRKELNIFYFFIVVWTLIFISFVVFEIVNKNAKKKLQQKDEFIEEALSIFSHFVDAKDSYTNGHSNRVAFYSKKIAERLGFSETKCKEVFHIALLHDCGKCNIPDEVLKKPGGLTEEEYEKIKKHTEYGAIILEDFKSLPDGHLGALYHHERYDGKGYPTGKKGEEIPLIGRIICVADAFDAMHSRRCYRDPLPMNKIKIELEKGSGTQFDPKIASIMLDLINKGDIK